jgi:hypothetical protein
MRLMMAWAWGRRNRRGLGIAGLGPGRHRAHLDEAEAEVAQGVDGLAVLVQASGQAHRVGEVQAHDPLGQDRHLGQEQLEQAQGVGLAQAGHGEVVGGFRVEPEEEGLGEVVGIHVGKTRVERRPLVSSFHISQSKPRPLSIRYEHCGKRGRHHLTAASGDRRRSRGEARGLVSSHGSGEQFPVENLAFVRVVLHPPGALARLPRRLLELEGLAGVLRVRLGHPEVVVVEYAQRLDHV